MNHLAESFMGFPSGIEFVQGKKTFTQKVTLLSTRSDQLRLGYDNTTKFVDISIDSTGQIIFSSQGINVLRMLGGSGSTFSQGVNFTGGLAIGSSGTINMANTADVISCGTTQLTSTASYFLFGGSATASYKIGFVANTAHSVTGGNCVANVIVGSNTIVVTSTGSGACPIVAGAAFLAPATTETANTITNSTNVYINGAPTGGTSTKTSLWVDDGVTRLDGALQLGYIAKSGSYTATTSDHTIEVTATGQTITLPDASTCTGREYVIKLTASGSCTVATTSSQNIDASTTYSLSAQYKYVKVQSNGIQWLITGNN